MTFDNGPQEPDPESQQLTEDALAVRRYAIGLTLATERLLESLGRPVSSAIIPSRRRRRVNKRNT